MSDLISRQAAYETLSEYYHHRTETQHKGLREALDRVPSAEPKIIHCGDCKYAEHESGGTWCLYFETIIHDDDFCSRAERRQDASNR